jgi:salicylate 5-hydroxylase large subunit
MQQQSPMQQQSETAVEMPVWSHEGSSRIPFWAYTDPEVYQRELQRIFYSKHWNYVGLEAEIPNPGDFKRTSVGERSIVIAGIRTVR